MSTGPKPPTPQNARAIRTMAKSIVAIATGDAENEKPLASARKAV
jgi:hypothetical protein